MNNSIAILAYGSLIDDPGPELGGLIKTTIQAETPFNIEYGRKSATRGNAPTLIIVSEGGTNVKAKILILDPAVDLQSAKNMLYRRERRNYEPTLTYSEPSPNSSRMRIRVLLDFHQVASVIYTDLPLNIDKITPSTLATLAIGSALTEAGDRQMDGIHYLKNNIQNGIITPLTLQYEQEILKQSNTASLQAAIELYKNMRQPN